MGKNFILLLALISFNNLLNAQDLFEKYKIDYDRLRKQEKHDSALVVAKQMNTWANKIETDTSLRYAVSLRYVGNCFTSLNNVDSAKFYFDFSLSSLTRQGRGKSINAIRCFHNIGVIYFNLKDYEKTDSLWAIVLDLNRQLDDKSDDFRDALNNLVALNNDWGRYDQSEKYILELLESAKLKYGEESPEYANRLNQLASIYRDNKNYEQANGISIKVLKIRENVLNQEHSDIGATYGNLGFYQTKFGNYLKAIEYFDIEFRNIEYNYGENSFQLIDVLDNLAICYYFIGNYKKSLEFRLKSSEISKITKNAESVDFAIKLETIAELNIKMNDYKLAELNISKALNIYSIKIGENSLEFANSLITLGFINSELGNNKQAKEYYFKAHEIIKNHKDTSNSYYKDYYSRSLASLGSIYQRSGEPRSAIKYYKEYINYLAQIPGKDSINFALGFDNLGLNYRDIGDYKNAEKYCLKALNTYTLLLGDKHPDVAQSLSSLGGLYILMANYQLAEKYLNKSLFINNLIFGKNNSSTAQNINDLGCLYLELGDYKLAKDYLVQSQEIVANVLGKESNVYADKLNNLGSLYERMLDYKAAESNYQQALDIYKKNLGEEDPSYALLLDNLGSIYLITGAYKLSELYCKQALEIRTNRLGKEHPDYANSLISLGFLSYRIGDYKSAEIYYEQALEIRKQALGAVHPHFGDLKTHYAIILTQTNREKKAFDILSKNFSKKASEIADNFEWLNDNQKEAYWKKESAFYDDLSWFANEAHEKVPEAVGLNYNSALVTKSKMLEAKISSENYYRDVDELREELAYRRRLLAKLESDGSTEKEKLEKLRKEADSLDKRLTLSWPEYAQQKKNLSITWDQVQQNLDNREAAIEFVRFYNADDSIYYYNSLVLKKGDKNPTLVKLCKEKDLQAITPKMGYSAYYPLIWQPMEVALKDVKTIYYAPTGELNNVPFHAIYAPKGKGDEVLAAKTDKRGVIIQNERAATEENAEYLMDRYTMQQLTSTRYLAMGLKQKARESIGNTMAMVGGVNYDYLPGSTTVPKKNKKDKNASRSSASASGKLNYLEGTKTEVAQINQQVTAATWQTKLIENNDAREENITKLEGKEAKGILHLATHGYAFPEYDFNDTTINKNSLRYSYRYSTNPMVRSGLILAGGNWAWTGSDTLSKLGAEQNGILTALEVSQLNLKKTKLVVLSACETGLGKIEGSEGTIGLKRGFKLAGVEQMIVSLWSVPDKETMELMTLFYSDLTKTLNPVTSFEKAQKEMRTKYPIDPEKWAGFVLVR
jgi:CHAT domain-containing protein/tetratricopeptide (TPR) repeat protein